MDIKSLRKTVKKLRIDLDLDAYGSLSELASAIGANERSLSMAITGYRGGPAYVSMLERLHQYLLSLKKSG